MRTWIWWGLGGIVATPVLLWLVLLMGMRTKSRRVLSGVRRLNRAFTNKRVMRSAGTPGAYAAVVRHVGRRTGTAYATPVGAVPTASGFVIALPYGTDADWVKNVLAAGSAVLEHEGDRHAVTAPELIAADDADRYFPAKDRRVHRWYGVDQFLLLRRAEVLAGDR